MIELYHNNLSVCAQKVRIVLAEKDLSWTSRYVSLVQGEQLTPQFKRMNPRGLVPVLVHDGNTIVEPSVICSYLDDAFPSPPLSPSNPVERATMRLWCKLTGRYFAHGLRDGQLRDLIRPATQETGGGRA